MSNTLLLRQHRTARMHEYLFAKQNKANIEDDELVSFRALAKAYAGLTALQIEQLLRDKDWMEICHG